MANKIWKDAPYPMSWGTYNQNNEILLLTYKNGPNSKYRQHQVQIRMWSNMNSHSLLLLMQNGTVISEDIWAISYKIKKSLTIQSSSHTLSIYSKEVNVIYTQEPAQGCFIVALVVVAQAWKQSRHSSVGEWIMNCSKSQQWNIIQH